MIKISVSVVANLSADPIISIHLHITYVLHLFHRQTSYRILVGLPVNMLPVNMLFQIIPVCQMTHVKEGGL